MADKSRITSEEKADKKARQFDFYTLFEETRKNAAERSREILEAREEEEAETRKKLQDSMHITLPTAKKTTGKTSDPTVPSTSATADTDDDSGEEIGPPIPAGLEEMKGAGAQPSTSNKDESHEDSGVEDDEFTDFSEGLSVEKLIPTTCEVTLNHGSKPVSSLHVDNQGARVLTGGYDYEAKIFDFAGMDSAFKPFRQFQPVESHIVRSVAYSCNGESILVASGNGQTKIFDRDGKEWGECIKGDQYIVDMAKTKGHIAGINHGCWHPYIKNEFMTCSNDGTIRLWNLEDWKVVTKTITQQRSVIKFKTAGGQRALPTACTYSRDGKYVVAAGNDGSIQMWRHGKLYVNTALCKRKAHENGSDVTSVVFSYDNNCLLSRGMDDTLKLWDVRMFKEAVNVATGLENYFPVTECAFSPRDELCVTGTSVKKGQGEGKLRFFDKNTFKVVYEISYPALSVTTVLWHPKINQVFVGLSNGEVKLYYDPIRSARGALLCAKKAVRRERKQEVITEQLVIAPLSLPMFQPRREDEDEKEVTSWRVKKYLRQLARDPNVTYKKAEEPFSGPGAGGKIAEGGGTLHSYLAQQMGIMKNKSLRDTESNIRDAILRHKDEAEADPVFTGGIYKRSQPTPIFQEKTTAPHEEPEEELQPVFKKTKIT